MTMITVADVIIVIALRKVPTISGNREISIKNRDFPTRIIEIILIFAVSIKKRSV